MELNREAVATIIENQLAVWPMAKANYDALRNVKRRSLDINGVKFELQCNPGRIGSTGAKIDAKSIAERPCFLCKSNRPAEQSALEIEPGWELLVNPFPILPVHLTLVSIEHVPQSHVPDDIVNLAVALPGMAVFFNGAHAGASAPDHLHLQAVLKDELPLLRMVEQLHRADDYGIKSSADLCPEYPYTFFSGVVGQGRQYLPTLIAGLNLGGPDERGRLNNPELVNTFFWLSDEGTLRFVVVPRTNHRPACYTAADDSRRMISPGCIDMAGIFILPRESDFERLTAEELHQVIKDVAV